MSVTTPSRFDRVPDAYIIEELERIAPTERPALRLPVPMPEPPPVEDDAADEKPPRVIIIDL